MAHLRWCSSVEEVTSAIWTFFYIESFVIIGFARFADYGSLEEEAQAIFAYGPQCTKAHNKSTPEHHDVLQTPMTNSI